METGVDEAFGGLSTLRFPAPVLCRLRLEPWEQAKFLHHPHPTWLLRPQTTLCIFSTSFLLAQRHSANSRRLFAGQEPG